MYVDVWGWEGGVHVGVWHVTLSHHLALHPPTEASDPGKAMVNSVSAGDS